MNKSLLLPSLLLSLALSAQSPYISRVWEYCPAPGQFVNELPAYEPGDDANTMRLKAEEAIADDNRGLISLGGWGGYVLFGFDHMVPNVAGENDLLILGNAFYSGTGDEQEGRRGGSCEPGIVLVSYDANANGTPDDPWYELAGSEYANPATLADYRVTYFRPAPGHEPTPSQTTPAITDSTYIPWRDNRAGQGYICRLSFHTQPYFPAWVENDSLTFTGTRLPDNFRDESGDGSYFVLYSFPFGYADNHPNGEQRAELDIDWAVRPDGSPADLPGIHFVKVYTGVHQQCGWLGETSTEVLGATDLHCFTALQPLPAGQPAAKDRRLIFSLTGTPLNAVPQHGVYIIREGNQTRKVIR